MVPLQNVKIVPCYLPVASVSGGNFTAVGNGNGEVDTLGYDYATFIFQFGAIAANVATLKVQETDVTGSGYADITGPNNVSSVATGAIFGTSALCDADGGAASSLPATGNANGTFLSEIDLKGRKRFLKPLATAGAGATFLTGICILSRAQVWPEKAADRNIVAAVRV